MEPKIKARLQWVELYNKTKDAGYTCRRCGISYPTLRKWDKRYKEKGIEGLSEHSRKPRNSPIKKVNDQITAAVLNLRNKRNFGARRIQSELIRENVNWHLSLATIHKILINNDSKPIVKLKRKKKFNRYQRPIPGERIQIDTCKIAPGIYQYTAIDDCSRWRVLEIYRRRTGANTLDFIDHLIEEFPFPIQRIQSDRGREFFAIAVQKKLMKYSIKFRPIKPASPHLNGKVERSQKTDIQEFYATVDLSNFDNLKELLNEWQFYYNYHRPHGSLAGKTPAQYSSELSNKTPFWDEVIDAYDPENEHVQEANYRIEMALRKLKRCL